MGIEVVVVEVAQRSLVANEEAGRTVAEAFVDFREGESDRADMAEMVIAHNYQCRIRTATDSAQATRRFVRVSAFVCESCGVTDGFQTERLSLRPVELSDLDLLVDLNGDVDVMEFITGRANSVDETAAELERSLGVRWLAFSRADEKFLGWVNAVPDRQGEQYEIGWRFKRSAWGKGYATEAGRALVDLVFSRGGRVGARV